MSRTAYVGEVFQLVYDTDGTQAGLTDMEFAVYLPDGTLDANGPFAATELGSTGVYRAAFTPALAGDHVAVASSATSSPAIANKAGSFRVEAHSPADIGGAGFDSATDSMEAIRDGLTSLGATAQGRVI